ncbi:MAG TPA: YbaB/EbfC family nucleoid-associated protein [Ruminococcaceae bacterium]|nr:YbaB/EbfC family nucleoid-associated protein [Oscillospiraceae bacterium]
MKARLPQGMGKGPGDLTSMMKQAQKMQEDIAKAQEELDAREFKATAGGGVVEAVMNGKKELLKLNIQPEAVDPEDIEMLQDLILAAVNQVIREVETTSNEQMQKITGKINMPGLF